MRTLSLTSHNLPLRSKAPTVSGGAMVVAGFRLNNVARTRPDAEQPPLVDAHPGSARRGSLRPDAARRGAAGRAAPARAGRRHPRWKLRLNPLRSRLDRRRVVAVHRLTVCGVPYVEPLGQGREAVQLTSAWRLASTRASGVPAPAGLLVPPGAGR